MNKKDELKALREELEKLRDKIYKACIVQNKIEGMNIGEAINAMRQGSLITRSVWRNPGIYIYLQPSPKGVFADSKIRPEFRVKTIQGFDAVWSPNHDELLATDWLITLGSPNGRA